MKNPKFPLINIHYWINVTTQTSRTIQLSLSIYVIFIYIFFVTKTPQINWKLNLKISFKYTYIELTLCLVLQHTKNYFLPTWKPYNIHYNIILYFFNRYIFHVYVFPTYNLHLYLIAIMKIEACHIKFKLRLNYSSLFVHI